MSGRRRAREQINLIPTPQLKLGGQTQPHVGHNFHLRPRPPSSEEVAAVIGPWLNFAIDVFGAERCMVRVLSV